MMDRKAYILADATDSPEAVGNLTNHLRENSIDPIVLSWSELMHGIYYRTMSKGLFYRNPYIRIESPKETLDFYLIKGFDAIYHEHNLEFLAFDPKKALVEHSRFYMPDPHSNFIVQSKNGGVGTQYMIDDNSSHPTILIYTHSRSTYFEMMFNSLIYSLNGDRGYPIKVMVNGEENVRNITSFIGSRYTNYDIEILICKENAYLGSCNAMVRYFDLEKFIIMEDDVILPQLLRYHVPHWPKQFVNRLGMGFDMVGFVAETYNRPLQHVWPSPPLNEQGGWYVGSPDNILPIMGQCIATTKSNYLAKISAKNFCATDEKLLKTSAKHCAPWLRPYHIGWNASMDYVKEIKRPESVGIVTIESLRTGVIKQINLL